MIQVEMYHLWAMLGCRITGLWTLFLMCLVTLSYGQEKHYEVTDLLREAYSNSLDLNLETARALCAQSRVDDPYNLLVEHIDNYNDFLRAFISERKEDLELFERHKNDRLDILRQGPSDSPYYYYSQAEIHLQWAMARSKHQQYIRAGWDINKAYKLLKKCKKAYPEFILADKNLSFIHALIGSISGFRRGAIKLFTALDGSVSQGIEEITTLCENREDLGLWESEVYLIRSLMYMHVERDEESAFAALGNINSEHQNLTLIRYFKGANLQKLGRAADAEVFLCLERQREFPFYYMDLQCGISRLNQLSDDADGPIRSYAQNFGGSNYLAEAYQKLAWYELIINQDATAYHDMMELCLSNGSNELGEDQQALLEAKANTPPHPDLLRARLLYDGGSYDQAMTILDNLKADILNEADRLEYAYRQGRVAHKQGENDKAKYWYNNTVNLGRNKPQYYACNAALQLAEINREEGDINKAKQYYQLCLDIDPDTYRSSLHQKSQLGLDALESSYKR